MGIFILIATHLGIWALGHLGSEGQVCLKVENSLINHFINLLSTWQGTAPNSFV